MVLDRFLEDDTSTRLQAAAFEDGGGGAGGTLASTLTAENQTPPVVVYQTLADGSGDASAPVPVVTTSAPVPTPPPIINSTNVGNKVAIGMTPTFMDHVKDKLGAAQSAVTVPFQAAGNKVAKAVGASDQTAVQVGIWLLPVVIVLAVAGTVYALRRRIFSHKITA